jgi:DNA-binding NarL/FixJ family response regulator
MIPGCIRGRSTLSVTLPRVLIVDDHEVFADGLAELLRGRCDVVGSIGDGSLLQEAAERLRPDIVLLDVSMPNMSGLEALTHLDAERLGCKVIMLTMYRDARLAAAALKAGALGFALKESSGEEVLTAVETVLHGDTYLTPALAGQVSRH